MSTRCRRTCRLSANVNPTRGQKAPLRCGAQFASEPTHYGESRYYPSALGLLELPKQAVSAAPAEKTNPAFAVDDLNAGSSLLEAEGI